MFFTQRYVAKWMILLKIRERLCFWSFDTLKTGSDSVEYPYFAIR